LVLQGAEAASMGSGLLSSMLLYPNPSSDGQLNVAITAHGTAQGQLDSLIWLGGSGLQKSSAFKTKAMLRSH
jgi:hypothetical protein